MAREMIDAIKQAEISGKEHLKAAEAEAVTMVQTVREEAMKGLAAETEALQREAKETLSQAEKKAEEMVQAAKAEALSEKNALKKLAEAKAKEALETVTAALLR